MTLTLPIPLALPNDLEDGDPGHLTHSDLVHLIVDALVQPDDEEWGLHINDVSPYYGSWFAFGNASDSMGFPGTGSPTHAYAPLVSYSKWGLNGDPVEHTTQTVAFIGRYETPTADDSAQCGSAFVLLVPHATEGAFTQTKQTIAFEMSAQISGACQHTGGYNLPMGGGGTHLYVRDTALIAHGYGFKALATIEPSATVQNYIAFWQPAASGADISYGVYVVDPIVTRTQIVVDEDGGDGLFSANMAGSGGGSPAFVFLRNPNGKTTWSTMQARAITSQTAPLADFWGAGASSPTTQVKSNGDITSKASIVSITSGGLARSGMDENGYLFTFQHTAAADADLAPGECSFWFDQTNGAPKLMIKAKSANGTVATGELALA